MGGLGTTIVAGTAAAGVGYLHETGTPEFAKSSAKWVSGALHSAADKIGGAADKIDGAVDQTGQTDQDQGFQGDHDQSDPQYQEDPQGDAPQQGQEEGDNKEGKGFPWGTVILVILLLAALTAGAWFFFFRSKSDDQEEDVEAQEE